MFPLRDNVTSKRFAFFNYLLIAINARVFWTELRSGRELDAFLLRYGLVPAVVFRTDFLDAHGLIDALAPFVTSMFLHGGWMHIISNMWMLHLFGRSVEGHLGHARYLFLYLASGIMAGLLQAATHWGSILPTIGASGAIAGVMGTYFILFPNARIATVIPVFFIPQVVEISAFSYLGIWFFAQLYSGVYSLGAHFGGIAWWAHIGGFVSGLALAWWLMPSRKNRFSR